MAREPLENLTPWRARAALALLVFAFVLGVLALPQGIVLIAMVVILLTIAPKGQITQIWRRARGR